MDTSGNSMKQSAKFLLTLMVISLLGNVQSALFGQKRTYYFSIEGVTFRGRKIPFQREKATEEPLAANGFEMSVYCLAYRQPPIPNNSHLSAHQRKLVLVGNDQKPPKNRNGNVIMITSDGCSPLFLIARLAKHDTMRVYLRIDYDNIPKFGSRSECMRIPFQPGNYLVDLRKPVSGSSVELDKSGRTHICWRKTKMPENWDPNQEIW